MTVGNCKVCNCTVCRERDAEKHLAGDWVDEPWSAWLPVMIRADYWRHFAACDVNAASLPKSGSDGNHKLDTQAIYPKRYFCTTCPQAGPLLPCQLRSDHAMHATIGISRLWDFTGVLRSELEAFLDVSDIKQNRGSDGQSYLQLRSATRRDRRVKSHAEITCFDCLIVKTTKDRRNILTVYCSVECQFSQRLSHDAAILFALMVPEDQCHRKFHHYLDYNLSPLRMVDAPAQKRSKAIDMVIDEDNVQPADVPQSTTRNAAQSLPFLVESPTVTGPVYYDHILAIKALHIS